MLPHDVPRVSKKSSSTARPQPVARPRGSAIVLYWVLALALGAVALAGINRFFLAKQEQQGGHTQFEAFSQRADMLRRETDPIKRDNLCIPLSAMGRSVDAQLPTNAHVFLLPFLGKENSGKLGYYYFLTYYLFPRELAISVDEPARYTMEGMFGKEPTSADQLVNAGYDIALHFSDAKGLQFQPLKQIEPRKPEDAVKPIPTGDPWLALLLPLATALAGARLCRWLFRDLDGALSHGEWMACGLALGAFVCTQAILGLRLAGLRLERGLALLVAAVAVYEVVLLVKQWRKAPPKVGTKHVWCLLLLPMLGMLWVFFRLAGLEGLQEFDAVAFWAFKAKMLHELSGSELMQWFRNPALGYAHLDYPLLASLLHSFTYGALGHVNEFVTKFWNVWMLVLLACAILGAARFPQRNAWLAAAGASCVLFLPMTLEFVRQEGATIPMMFFAVTSSLQLAVGMAAKNPARLRLGLLLMMTTAMVKFEGMVLLAFWVVMLLLDKASRVALWPPKALLRVVSVGVAGWVPYLIFRLQGPVLHPESAWLSHLLHQTSEVIHLAPLTCLGFVSRRFLNNDFAAWTALDNQHAEWSGKWAGLSSLVDQATLGLAWVCVLMLVVSFCRNGRCVRWALLRFAAVFLLFGTAVGVIWSATHSSPLDYAGSLNGSAGITGGRYLYPVLVSWFAAGIVLLSRGETKSSAPTE